MSEERRGGPTHSIARELRNIREKCYRELGKETTDRLIAEGAGPRKAIPPDPRRSFRVPDEIKRILRKAMDDGWIDLTP